jgi:hypothetical protein
MPNYTSFLSVTLISALGFITVEAQAQDGEACLAIIKRGNDLNARISQVRKKADDEEECNAEAKLWSQAANLVEQRLTLEKQKKIVCEGFTLTGGISIDELTDRAVKMREYEAKAKDGCDIPPPPPPAKAENNDIGLVGSATITCFGGGDCKSQNKSSPPAGSGPQPASKGKQSTITGEKFGDTRPSGSSSGVTTAK